MNMTSGGEARDLFRFGRFELDVRSAELRKDGIRIRLQGQPFDVLVMLLQRPGEVLTREELRRQLWPEGTFVDFEHGLNAAVKRLRAALGDNAERPRFVETLHRRGYRFIGPLESSLTPAPGDAVRAGSNGNHKRRLAVLPFATLSGSADHDYFTEGLREEMITQLGRLCAGRLGVIGRTSSTLIQRTATRSRDVGQALRVDFVVEGNVRRDGDRVRITVQLVETRGETQIWAESYDRHLADCFQVQSDVAREIVQSVAVELLPGTGAQPGALTPEPLRTCSRNVSAQQAYLKGRYHWNRALASALPQAIGFLEQAVSLDPKFACAHSGLGRAYVSAVNQYLLDSRSGLDRARRAALTALELDPTDAEAHLTLAEVNKILEHDWPGAEKAYRTALAFNASSEAIHRHYGQFLAARGRIQEASAAADRACDLDPLCLVVNTSAAWVRYLAREYQEAIERCRHTLDMDEAFVPARRLLAVALLHRGDREEATAELEALAGDRPDPVTLAWIVHGFALKGDSTRAGTALQQLDKLAQAQTTSSYFKAMAHAAAGDSEDAITLLTRAVDECDPAVVNLGVDPRLDVLRCDSRYRELVNRLALPHR
ncbi:MAG TPA: winged helix-turn-helix domain-containing protein [Vicinamibacterales bacterium]|nr:winged helix-turn-helix domain-containing protein [Vicinamibacterales bacterium]